MEAQVLLDKYFETAFSAPDGVKKLRELILSLAMQGTLVPQDPSDQPASELLKEIEAEKERLIKEGKIKKSKPLSEITSDEIPYNLPESWEWIKLGQITEYNGRNNIQPNEILDNTWLLDLEDIEKDTSRIIYKAKYFERKSKSTKSIFKKGDVLYGKLRPYLNKVVVADDDGVCTTEIAPIVPYLGIDPHFLKLLLKRPSFLNYVNSLMYGVKMPRLGTNHAVESIHPLPPFEEQKRIVKKIDRLMEQCDRLEKLRKEHHQKRLIIHTAARDRLLNAIDQNSLNQSWNFIQNNFGELYSVKENVSELRKIILQLAVMGKLIPQDPNDPPASELLKQIEEEKDKLIKERKVKKQKLLSKITPDEILYEIPENWEWIRMDDLCVGITSGSTPPNNLFSSQEGIPFLKVYNIREQKIDFYYKPQYVSQEYHLTTGKRSCLLPGDVIMNIVGPPLGKVAIIPNDFPEYNCNQAIVFFRPIEISLNKYLYTYLLAGIFLNNIELIGTAGQDNISVTKSRSIPIPLPPLREQHRIVEKVDQLMKMCDQLEQQIEQSTDKRTQLLNAILSNIQ